MKTNRRNAQLHRQLNILALAVMVILCVCLCACEKTSSGEETQASTTEAQLDDSGRIISVIDTARTEYNVVPDSEDFQLDASSNSDGEIRYRSSNPSIASVGSSGEVSVGSRIGIANISIAVPETEKYTAASKTVRVKVAKKQKLKVEPAEYQVDYGAAPFKISATTDIKSNKKMRYETGDREIAVVDSEGLVTVKNTGKTIITVTAPGTRQYHDAVAEVTVEVDRKSQTITLGKESYDISLVGPVDMEATCDSGGKLSYKSSDPSIITVSKDGKLNAVAMGEASVTVTQKGTKDYKPAKKTVKVSVRESTTDEERAAAVAWAIDIANDDSFSYGAGRGAHRYGCYFCGTNWGPKMYKKPNEQYEKTYCCNPFIHAAYSHGAKNKAMLRACQKGSGVGLSAGSFEKYGCWENIGKPGFDQLIPGDVFLKKGKHVSMYVGGDDEVEAAGSNWKPSSIAVRSSARARYNSCTCVMRYIGD